METTTTTPRAWIGCLACYNNGRLRGQWIDAETAAAEVDADAITYGGQATPRTYPSGSAGVFCKACHGDEFDVFDYENVPRSCAGIRSFYDNANYLAEAGSDLLERLQILSGWLGGDLTLEELATYDEDNYCGQWARFQDYAEHLADEIGLLGEMPETLSHYFDWEAWSRDLEHDYYTENGHIWRSC